MFDQEIWMCSACFLTDVQKEIARFCSCRSGFGVDAAALKPSSTQAEPLGEHAGIQVFYLHLQVIGYEFQGYLAALYSPI